MAEPTGPCSNARPSSPNPVGGAMRSSATAEDANNMAEPTGLEPATSRVTGERSNQLNYHSAGQFRICVMRLVPAFYRTLPKQSNSESNPG